MKPKIIFVEGNIGAGKTTFLKNINIPQLNIQKIFEPVSEWIQSGMLDKFYRDPDKYAYEFQLYCLKTRFDLFKKIDTTVDYVFIERSPMCDKFVFAGVCLENKPEQLQQYHDIWNEYMNTIYTTEYNYDFHFLYINDTAENCHKHICDRARQEETNISLDYLQKLEERHNTWFNYHDQILYNHFTYHTKDNHCYINTYGFDIRYSDNVDNIVLNTIQYIQNRDI